MFRSFLSAANHIAVAVVVISFLSVSPLAAQEAGSDLQVDDVIRSLKPAASPPPGVRTRGLPQARGVSVELPGSGSPSADIAEGSTAPSIDLSIEFDFNSHTLTKKGETALTVLGEALTSSDLEEYRFLIAGHTDAKGGEDYNQILSELRARAVKDFLTGRYKIGSDRLVAKGFGESQLLKPDSPDSAANRRVQVTNLGEN